MENEDRGRTHGSDADDASADPPESETQRTAVAVSSEDGDGFGHEGGEATARVTRRLNPGGLAFVAWSLS